MNQEMFRLEDRGVFFENRVKWTYPTTVIEGSFVIPTFRLFA